MTYEYKTHGTCSKSIHLAIEDGIIKDVSFIGGCDGNLQGICRLVIGQDAAKVREILTGVNCSGRGTSCPDQLAKAITMALESAEG